MYFEIKELLARGLSYSAIGRLTGLDRRTTAVYAKKLKVISWLSQLRQKVEGRNLTNLKLK